jgi:hypothetical protein
MAESVKEVSDEIVPRRRRGRKAGTPVDESIGSMIEPDLQ